MGLFLSGMCLPHLPDLLSKVQIYSYSGVLFWFYLSAVGGLRWIKHITCFTRLIRTPAINSKYLVYHIRCAHLVHYILSGFIVSAFICYFAKVQNIFTIRKSKL